MQFKFIDSKMKEIYFTPSILIEEEEKVNQRFNFFHTMDVIALQNQAIHNCF